MWSFYVVVGKKLGTSTQLVSKGAKRPTACLVVVLVEESTSGRRSRKVCRKIAVYTNIQTTITVQRTVPYLKETLAAMHAYARPAWRDQHGMRPGQCVPCTHAGMAGATHGRCSPVPPFHLPRSAEVAWAWQQQLLEAAVWPCGRFAHHCVPLQASRWDPLETNANADACPACLPRRMQLFTFLASNRGYWPPASNQGIGRHANRRPEALSCLRITERVAYKRLYC